MYHSTFMTEKHQHLKDTAIQALLELLEDDSVYQPMVLDSLKVIEKEIEKWKSEHVIETSDYNY